VLAVDEPYPRELRVVGEHLYWLAADRLRRMPCAGAPPVTLAEGVVAYAIDADEQHALTLDTDGTLARTRLADVTPEVVLATLPDARGLVRAGSDVLVSLADAVVAVAL
jgi:hypothetical protein